MKFQNETAQIHFLSAILVAWLRAARRCLGSPLGLLKPWPNDQTFSSNIMFVTGYTVVHN